MNTAHRPVLFCGSLALLLAGSSLLGWATGNHILASLLPDRPSMQPITAVCAALIALALLLRPGRGASGHAVAGRVSLFVAGSVAIIALWTLVAAVAPVPVPFDRLLFPDSVAAQARYPIPGRMAAGTAASLLLLAASLIRVANGRGGGAAANRATLALILPALGLIGHLLSLDLFSGLGLLTAMAAPTSVALLALGIGILALTPDQGWIRHLRGGGLGARAARSLLPVAVLAPVLSAGLLNAGYRAGHYSGDFLVALLALMTAAALGAAVVLHAGRLDRSERLLRLSEEMFRGVTDAQPGFVFVTDAEGGNTFVNGTFLEFAGVGFDELMGDGWLRALHPDDRAIALATWRDAVAKRSVYAIEYRFRRRDGAYRWYAIRGAPVRDPMTGEIRRWVGVCVDIDDRRRAEAALRAERDRVRGYLDVAHVMLLVLDRDGRIREINRRGVEILGRETEGDLIGQCWFDLAVPERDREAIRAGFQGLMQGAMDMARFENTVVRADGSERLVQWRNSVLRDEDGGVIGSLSSGEDVTDLRRSDEAVRTGEALLNAVLEALPVGVIIADREGRLVRINAAAARLWGTPPPTHSWREYDQWVGRWPDTGDVIAPEDWAMTRTLRQGATITNELVEAQRFGTGERRLYLNNTAPVRDDSGRIVMGVAAMQDVTDRLATEAVLRRVVDGAPLPVMVHADDGQVLHLSRAWLETTGYRFDQIASMEDWLRRAYGDRADDLRSRIDALFTRDEPTVFADLDVRAADGRVLVWSFHSALVGTDARGRRLAVSMAADLTARRDAEARTRLLMREVDHRAKNALAVVQAVLRLSAADNPKDYVEAVEGRISAMARAHSLLAAGGWSGADLHRLVEDELAAWSDGHRVAIAGPAVRIDAEAAQSVSLALHELVTNAAKYGALSVPEGTLDIVWRATDEGELCVEWTERNGPRIASPPTRRGFGTDLLVHSIGGQLGGRLNKRWEAEGLVCHIALPDHCWRGADLAAPLATAG